MRKLKKKNLLAAQTFHVNLLQMLVAKDYALENPEQWEEAFLHFSRMSDEIMDELILEMERVCDTYGNPFVVNCGGEMYAVPKGVAVHLTEYHSTAIRVIFQSYTGTLYLWGNYWGVDNLKIFCEVGSILWPKM